MKKYQQLKVENMMMTSQLFAIVPVSLTID